MVTSRLQFLLANPMRLITIAVMAAPAPETVITEYQIWINLARQKKEGRFGHNIMNTSSAIINKKSLLPPNMVLTIAKETAAASPALEMLPCDPPLNAKKPKNKINPPRAHCCTRENENISIYQVT